MGLFDNTSSSSAVAQDYGGVNFNQILGVAGQVASFLKSIMPILQKWFISGTTTDHEKVLGERLLDQVPGMYLTLAKAGLFDAKTILYLQQRPHSAELTDRHYGQFDKVIPIAQMLFTVLFGVRIMDGWDLDALDKGVDAYYNVGTTVQQNLLGTPLVRFHRHDDIPRKAVERAVMLKQKFFSIATYNKKQWDMNKFQEYPLVAPVPGLQYGLLYSGPVPLGGELLDGILISAGPYATERQSGEFENVITPPQQGAAKTNSSLWAGVAAAAVALYLLYDSDS